LKKRQKKKVDTEYWSICEYAQYYGISESTVRRMIKSGKLKAIRISGSWRIRKED